MRACAGSLMKASYAASLITNQYFNDSAKKQSGLLKVELIEHDGLLFLLNQYPIQLQEFLLAVA